MQIGSPAELYLRPNSAFVAEFIGQTNLLEGEVTGSQKDEVLVKTPIGVLRAKSGFATGSRVLLSIRPEHLRIDSGMRQNSIDAKLLASTFLGENSEHVLKIGDVELKAIASPPVLKESGSVTLSMKPEDVVVLPE
jgi:ABC-type Fe3+/spermidine/putrescine transport system ATPase subunit